MPAVSKPSAGSLTLMSPASVRGLTHTLTLVGCISPSKPRRAILKYPRGPGSRSGGQQHRRGHVHFARRIRVKATAQAIWVSASTMRSCWLRAYGWVDADLPRPRLAEELVYRPPDGSTSSTAALGRTSSTEAPGRTSSTEAPGRTSSTEARGASPVEAAGFSEISLISAWNSASSAAVAGTEKSGTSARLSPASWSSGISLDIVWGELKGVKISRDVSKMSG